MKHLTPYRQNEKSLSPVRGKGIVLVFSYREQINSFYPVLYIKILDMTKVLYIVSDNRQTCSFCSTAYEKVEILNVFFHNSNSLLLAVLLSRISLIISSAERLSFQAPAKRLAQSDSVLAFFAGTNDFTKASIFVIADSLSRSGLISRNNSARKSIAVIIVIFLFSGARTVQAESNQVHLNCRGVARSRILRLQRYKEKSNKQRIRIK